MTEKLRKICREEEKEYERKSEIEKEAKVKDALKNIIDDFNAYNKSHLAKTTKGILKGHKTPMGTFLARRKQVRK